MDPSCIIKKKKLKCKHCLRPSSYLVFTSVSARSEQGLAHLSDYLCLCSQALERFYEAVMQAILRHINFDGSASL